MSTLGSRYRGMSHYRYIPGLFISTKKSPGPCYKYSIPITRYVRINFVPIVNPTRGEGGDIDTHRKVKNLSMP